MSTYNLIGPSSFSNQVENLLDKLSHDLINSVKYKWNLIGLILRFFLFLSKTNTIFLKRIFFSKEIQKTSF